MQVADPSTFHAAEYVQLSVSIIFCYGREEET
jgi:hypothetical protein